MKQKINAAEYLIICVCVCVCVCVTWLELLGSELVSAEQWLWSRSGSEETPDRTLASEELRTTTETLLHHHVTDLRHQIFAGFQHDEELRVRCDSLENTGCLNWKLRDIHVVDLVNTGTPDQYWL